MQQKFRVGSIDLTCLSDGHARTSIEKTIGIDRQTAEELVGGTQEGWLFIPVNAYLFRRDENRILIDAGSGSRVQPSLGKLLGNMRELGIDPADITHILLTHLHSDHANGLIDEAGSATFPNAEILIHDQEFTFWMGDGPPDEPQKIMQSRQQNQMNLRPYLDRIRRMREPDSALGCSPMLAPGHTPGHTCWRISAGAETLLAWGDTVHFASIQIGQPEVAVTYDMDAAGARASRLRVLDMAARERLVIAGTHVEEPGVGRICYDEFFRYSPL